MPEEQEGMSAAADSEFQVERTVQRSEVAVGSRILSPCDSPAIKMSSFGVRALRLLKSHLSLL